MSPLRSGYGPPPSSGEWDLWGSGAMPNMHGDIYPLPDPGLPPSVRRSAFDSKYLYRRSLARNDRLHRVRECALALNQCASATVRSAHACEPACQSQQSLSPAQASVMQRIGRRVGSFGPRPAGLTTRGAVIELLKVRDLYDQQPTALAPFDPNKLKILRPDWEVKPVEVVDRAPPEVREAFLNPTQFRRSEEEMEVIRASSDPVYPYWDPVLSNNRSERIKFIKQLADKGLVSFRREIFCKVGVFFVAKKRDQIRMVIDARLVNQSHRTPPHVALGSPSAWADLNLSDAPSLASLLTPESDPADSLDSPPLPDGSSPNSELYFASGDLQDSFYQFKCEALASDFGMDFPEAASEYGCSQVWVDGEFVPVSGETRVFPVFCGVAMGWSWALWTCHQTVASFVSDSSSAAPDPMLVEDRRVPPCVSTSHPVAGVYVDNFAVVGFGRAAVEKRFDQTVSSLTGAGFALHELVGPSSGPEPFENVGLHLWGDEKRLRPKSSRAWRLYLALHGLTEVRSVWGWQLRVVLGHIVNYFQLTPLVLSVLSSAYTFVQANLDRSAPLWPEVRDELRLVAGFVFLCEVDLAAPASEVAFCGDSSTDGYALHAARLRPGEFLEATAVKERWRFTTVEKLPGPGRRTATRGWSADLGRASGPLADWLGRDFTTPPRGLLPGRPVQESREEEEVEIPGLVPPLADELLEPNRWKLVVAGAWKYSGPIHNKEARVAVMSLRHCTRSVSYHGTRVLTLGDNLSELCASEKGRASDRALRVLLQHALAYTLGPEVRWKRRYVESARNPSDHDSREIYRLRAAGLSHAGRPPESDSRVRRSDIANPDWYCRTGPAAGRQGLVLRKPVPKDARGLKGERRVLDQARRLGRRKETWRAIRSKRPVTRRSGPRQGRNGPRQGPVSSSAEPALPAGLSVCSRRVDVLGSSRLPPGLSLSPGPCSASSDPSHSPRVVSSVVPDACAVQTAASPIRPRPLAACPSLPDPHPVLPTSDSSLRPSDQSSGVDCSFLSGQVESQPLQRSQSRPHPPQPASLGHKLRLGRNGPRHAPKGDAGSCSPAASRSAPSDSGPFRSALRRPPDPLVAPAPSGRRYKRRAVLELFSGCGRLTGACSSLGLGVSVPFEIKNGSEFDLTDKRVQAVVLKWIRTRRVWFVHSGTVCTGFSVAATTQSDPRMRQLSLECARFTLRVMRLCRKFGVYYSVENPASSALFKWKPFAAAMRWPCSVSFVYDNCRFGAAWLKPTRIVTNLPELAVLGVRCAGGHSHVPLRGQVRIDGKWVWRTSLAGAYPPALCWRWGALLASVAPKAAWRDGKDSLLSSKWQSELCTACRLGKPEVQQLVPSCPARFSLPWPRGAPEWGTSHKAASSRPA